MTFSNVRNTQDVWGFVLLTKTFANKLSVLWLIGRTYNNDDCETKSATDLT